jgi:hypothetical protein
VEGITTAPAARASAIVLSSLPPSTTITSGGAYVDEPSVVVEHDVEQPQRALSTARRTFASSFSAWHLGLALSTTSCCASTHIQLMTPSIVLAMQLI